MNNKGLWDNQEVQNLFENVEKIKSNNKPLKNAFIEHAVKYGRKPNSVRNYYYHEIDNLKSDKERLNVLKIDLSKHLKSSIIYFSAEEEQTLMKEIDKLVKDGVSVRKACYTLSNGDVGKMLRYQNKYRNYISKNKENKIVSNDNIIKFTKKKNIISESEIQSLFMGLVRLVKRNTIEEINDKIKIEFENKNIELRKTLIELHKKEKEYQNLKEEFAKIKNENSKLLENVLKLKCDKASRLREKLKKTNCIDVSQI